MCIGDRYRGRRLDRLRLNIVLIIYLGYSHMLIRNKIQKTKKEKRIDAETLKERQEDETVAVYSLLPDQPRDHRLFDDLIEVSQSAIVSRCLKYTPSISILVDDNPTYCICHLHSSCLNCHSLISQTLSDTEI